MIEGLVWLVIGLGATIGFGLPLAVRLARPHAWRNPAARDTGDGLMEPERVEPAFKPIDMGPTPMRWPSEGGERFVGVTLQPWPSETWDDPHFGRNRERPAPAAPSATGPEPAPAPTTTTHAPVKATQPRRAPAADRAGGWVADAPAPAPKRRPPHAPKRAAGRPPTPAELQVLVESSGLAGAVKAIMAATGWDFRQAAQYLAKNRPN